MTEPHGVPLPQVPLPQTVADDGREARPAPATSADGRPVGRPAPQYGEYAPEGWVNPVEAERERRDREAAARRRELAALEAARARQTRSGPPGRAGGGVPRPGSTTGPDDHARKRPGAGPGTGPGAAPGVRSRFGASPGDLMITVLLLVFGLTTVLQQLVGIGSVASQVALQIEQRYVALANPQALVPATALSAVIGAVLFAGALWLSVIRLRRRRVTFWVPLVAGALAGLVTTIVYVVVIMHDPAFVSWIMAHRGTA